MAKKLPNILFFGIDSIRSDHMSCYGYPRQTTPHFDKLAEESVLFENNFSPVVPTTPAYTAMLSGMDQFTTRVVSLSHAGDDKSGKLATNFKLLPEILKDLGYYSVCIGFDGGFYRGFDEYHGYASWHPDETGYSRKAESLNSVALPKMNELASQDKPWMLFLRHMDPHTPYLPPPPFNRLFYTGDECAPGNNSMQPVWTSRTSPNTSGRGCQTASRISSMSTRATTARWPTWTPAASSFSTGWKSWALKRRRW